MPTIDLPGSEPVVRVHLPKDLEAPELLNFPAFQIWHSTLRHSFAAQKSPQHVFHHRPYSLRNIDVQCIDRFGAGRLGFVKMRAEVANADNETLPGSVFLRGGSVGMLLILQPDDVPQDSQEEQYVILTVQPRIPVGSLAFAELPAGMLDDSGSFAGAAAKEIAEETGLEIAAQDLLSLTDLALDAALDDGERLQRGVYPSPGGSDEFVPLFLWQKRVERGTLQQWQGKLTGLRDHGEKITLMLCPLEKLWRMAGRDAKALSAWALFRGLRDEGRL